MSLEIREGAGDAGEAAAVEHFRNLGYGILSRNYKTRYGELDIVLQKGNRVVFVEVRLRRARDWGTPESTVTRSKQSRIVKSAIQFIKEMRLKDMEFRFDVLAFDEEEVRHIENAFDAPRRYIL